jgi:NAD(P)-dependent dehydrogenase (short-subunit alcohol dehydrogenase family)
MGLVCARELAAKGFHSIIACRDPARGEAALQALREGNPAGSFELELLDLSDLGSVSDMVKRTCDKGTPIDVLMNNAGVMATPEMQTKDGFEFQLGVNHLGHFALTAGLMPLLVNHERYLPVPIHIWQCPSRHEQQFTAPELHKSMTCSIGAQCCDGHARPMITFRSPAWQHKRRCSSTPRIGVLGT